MRGDQRHRPPVVVVCSTGIDLDLVPTAADCRRLYDPDAGLVIVIPEGDDHPVTLALGGGLEPTRRGPDRAPIVGRSARRRDRAGDRRYSGFWALSEYISGSRPGPGQR